MKETTVLDGIKISTDKKWSILYHLDKTRKGYRIYLQLGVVGYSAINTYVIVLSETEDITTFNTIERIVKKFIKKCEKMLDELYL